MKATAKRNKFFDRSTLNAIFVGGALGIIGAVVGGYLGQRFFGVGVTGFNVMSFAVAVVGSLLVIFIGRLLTRS